MYQQVLSDTQVPRVYGAPRKRRAREETEEELAEILLVEREYREMRRIARTLAEKVLVSGEVVESTYASTLDAVSLKGSSSSSQEFARKQEVESPKKEFCANDILSMIQPKLIKEMKVPELTRHSRVRK